MAFSLHTLEALAAWCRSSTELAAQRRLARAAFFAEDDPSPSAYMPGTDDPESRERRFLGYFMFDWALPDGEQAAAVAAQRLLEGQQLADALAAIQGQRFVMAAVTSIVGRSVYLALGKERFEVRSPQWAALVERGLALNARIVPVRNHYWIPGPGWTMLGITLTPNAIEALPGMQASAIEFERMLQGRTGQDDEVPPQPQFDDDSLTAAVERMTRWAEEQGHPALVMAEAAWAEMVLRYMTDQQVSNFYHDVVDLGVELRDLADINELVALASNIWNNTPQPDRGGKTANELVRARR